MSGLLAVVLVNQGAMLLFICQFTRDVIECYECRLKWFLLAPSYLLYLVSLALVSFVE